MGVREVTPAKYIKIAFKETVSDVRLGPRGPENLLKTFKCAKFKVRNTTFQDIYNCLRHNS